MLTDAGHISDADEVITSADWLDDHRLLGESLVRVSTVDDLRGITPEMFSWWFAHMNEESYGRFHPCDHKDFAWTRGKRAGEYLGATHRTHHQYGGAGPLLRSEISFVDPTTLFSAEALGRLGGGVALSAVVHMLDEENTPEPDEAGRFAHVVLPRTDGVELRCRWWLNIGPDSDLELLTVARMRHVHEEFAYLVDFLPEMFDHEADGDA